MSALRYLPVVLLAGFAIVAPADDCEHGVDLSYYLKQDPRSPKTAISTNAMKMTMTLNGITFDSNYDNGSLFSMVANSTNVFTGALFNEDNIDGLGTRKYHFRFKMTGVAGRTITINLDHSQTPRPSVRIGTGAWRRMTSAESPNSTQMVLTFGAGENLAELAFFDPLGYKEIHDQVNTIVSTGMNATTEVLGLSKQNRQQWLVTVTDPAYPAAGKHRIWVHARAHAGEVTASHTALGFLERITENSATGQRLRRYCIFNVVPTLNVDGVYLGCTRWDSQGIDPERQWNNPTRIPEVQNIYNRVNTYMAGSNPIKVGLNLHSTVNDFTDSFFFKHIRPSVTANFETIQQNYINSLNNVTSFFNNFSAQTSQLDPSIFVESYFWNNWQESVMAMTHEGHYYERVTSSPSVPGPYITGSDYREIGRSMASAMIEYFGVPLPSSVEDYQLY